MVLSKAFSMRAFRPPSCIPLLCGACKRGLSPFWLKRVCGRSKSGGLAANWTLRPRNREEQGLDYGDNEMARVRGLGQGSGERDRRLRVIGRGEQARWT